MQDSKGWESGDKGTGSERARYGKRESKVREAQDSDTPVSPPPINMCIEYPCTFIHAVLLTYNMKLSIKLNISESLGISYNSKNKKLILRKTDFPVSDIAINSPLFISGTS